MKALSRLSIFTGNFVVLGGILQGLQKVQWIASLNVILWILIGVIMMAVGAIVISHE